MYFNPRDSLWFKNRKEAKLYYGASRFRKMLRTKEIIFTDVRDQKDVNNTNKPIANYELYNYSQENQLYQEH